MTANPFSGAIPTRHYAMLLFLAALWGSSFLVIKIAVETIPPITLTTIRMGVGMLLLWSLLIFRGGTLPNSMRLWLMCFWVGFFGNALPFTLINWGEQEVASGLTAVLLAVMPLATVILAHFFTANDRLTAQRLTGIGFGFIGIVVLVGPSVMEGIGGALVPQLAIAGAGICYAITAILARNMPPSSTLSRSAAIMISATLLMLPFAIWIDRPWTLEPSGTALLLAVHLGLLPTGVATLVFLKLVEARGAGFMAYINYLVPVLGVLWGALLLNEEVTPQILVALGAILIGLFIANYRRHPANKEVPS